MQKGSVSVIGAGFAGIAASTVLGAEGYDVTVYEKNSTPGGRARKFEAQGFVYDMGPSWYWMPDVFERYFARFGKKVSDYYSLQRLDPSYRIYFGPADYWDVPAQMDELLSFFEKQETGSSKKLKNFLEEGAFKYEVGMKNLVYNPGISLLELINIDLLKGLSRLHVFQSISGYIRKYFKSPRLIQLLEFPVLFLGASPSQTPALYSLMNYADMALGTWYPTGGMNKIVEGMVRLAKEKGVKFRFNSEINKITVEDSSVKSLTSHDEEIATDYVIAGADYHHVDRELLPPAYSNYREPYWENRKLAPSSLIFYLGINKRLKNLLHHNLFFDQDFALHTSEIYTNPKWPTNPLFYVCCPSKTDDSVAPEGMENLFILIPVAPGLEDEALIREKYATLILDRLEKLTGQAIKEHIVYQRSYAHKDFISDYNSFKGNAYGLANTLRQTANLKPSVLNKKIYNLFYTGQLTVPGPGVPPSLISGQVVADELIKRMCKN